MLKSFRFAALVMTGLLLSHGTANALLIDRGGGLIYDTELDVTWMQDAQYAITTGATSSGGLDWLAATQWAGDVQYYDSVRGVVWTDWRLPSTSNRSNGMVYDLTGESSELAFMFYVNLGYAANYSHNRNDPAPTSMSYNPFVNLAYRAYWFGTPADLAGRAWAFHFHFGSQEYGSATDQSRVWLVRDGDVAVPEPYDLGLALLGMIGLARVRRRR